MLVYCAPDSLMEEVQRITEGTEVLLTSGGAGLDYPATSEKGKKKGKPVGSRNSPAPKREKEAPSSPWFYFSQDALKSGDREAQALEDLRTGPVNTRPGKSREGKRGKDKICFPRRYVAYRTGTEYRRRFRVAGGGRGKRCRKKNVKKERARKKTEPSGERPPKGFSPLLEEKGLRGCP